MKQNNSKTVHKTKRISEQPGFVPLPKDGVYTVELLNSLFAGNQQEFAYHLYDLAKQAQKARENDA